MPHNTDVVQWLEIAKALLRSLVGTNPPPALFGVGLDAQVFAELVDRESLRVDHALTAMAVAHDEKEVLAVFGQLSSDTRTVLLSRFPHYLKAWSGMLENPAPRLWVPPKQNEVWRAVFLAMTGENVHSSEAASALWPERFGTGAMPREA